MIRARNANLEKGAQYQCLSRGLLTAKWCTVKLIAVCACLLMVTGQQGGPRCRVANCHRCMVNGSRCDTSYCMLGHHYEEDTGQCLPCLQANCSKCNDDMAVCDQCSEGHFFDSSGNCTECASNCRSCTAIDMCSSGGCRPGYRLQSAYLCEACAVSMCRICTIGVNSCMPNGCQSQYRLTRASTRCSLCIIQNCARCDMDVSLCDTGGCLPGYTLKQSSCVECGGNCLRCDSVSLLCEEGGCANNYLRGPDAVCRFQSCPPGYGPNLHNTDCVACIVHCDQCNMLPTSCDPGHCATIYRRMDRGDCTHFENCTANCLSCQLNVARCDSGHCEAGYELDADGLCAEVIACPDHCLSCMFNTSRCDIGQCAEGYQVDLDTGSCVPVVTEDDTVLGLVFVAIPFIVVPIAIAISVVKHRRHQQQQQQQRPAPVAVASAIIPRSMHTVTGIDDVIKRLSVANVSSSSSSSSSTLHDPHWQDLKDEDADIMFGTPLGSQLSLEARERLGASHAENTNGKRAIWHDSMSP